MTMMTDEISKKKLGRGLSALLGDDVASDYADLDKVRSTKEVPVEQLRANQFQPRQDWDKEALQGLADSIGEKGILQPILVRRNPGKDGEYEIIAGERRWRAAQMAQLHEVPVIIKEFTDAESMEIAIIENIQREDLSPIEEAEAYRKLMDDFGYVQETLSKKVGKSRSYLANILRLLILPTNVQAMIRDGRLTAGAGRTLINAEDPEAMAFQIVDGGLTVREAEDLVRKDSKKKTPGDNIAKRQQAWKSADVIALEEDLSAAIGMAVDIDHKENGTGTLIIRYGDLDQLDDACRRLTREPLHLLGEEEDPLDPSDMVEIYPYKGEMTEAISDALEDPNGNGEEK